MTKQRYNLWFAGMILAAIACCATNATAGTIRMWNEAVVTGDKVLISDVCDVRDFSAQESDRLSSIELISAPEVGGMVSISIDTVRSALSTGGVNLCTVVLKGASSCMIARPRRVEREKTATTAPVSESTEIESNDGTLRTAVIGFIERQLALKDAKPVVQFGRAPQQVLDLHGPRFSFDIRKTSGQMLGLVGLEVTVNSADEVVQSIPLLVNVSFSKRVVVAAKSINMGETLSAGDVHLVDMTFTRFDQIGLDDTAAAVGQRAKRFVTAGEVIKTRDLEKVPLVKRGQIVDVHSQVGGVAVVTAAKAMQSGTYGDIIELRPNGRNQAKTSAMVIGPGSVQVGVAAPETKEVGISLAMGGSR